MNPSPDDVLTSVRTTLLRYGARNDAFLYSLCSCEDPACAYREPETYPLHVLLQDVARSTAGRLCAPADETAEDATLRGDLLRLGSAYDLFACACDEPACPARTAPSAPLAQLAYAVFLQWFGLSGAVGRDGAEQARRAAELAIRNLHAVQVWTARMSSLPTPFLEAGLQHYAVARDRASHREAQALAAECAGRWIPVLADLPEVEDAMELVLLIAEASAWPDDQVRDWLLLSNDAVLALMTRDLLDPRMSRQLYSPMEDVIPLRDVLVGVLAGETGAPPGFFRFGRETVLPP